MRHANTSIAAVKLFSDRISEVDNHAASKKR